MKRFIPVCEPSIGKNEVAYVTEAVTSGWISSSGPYISKFEVEFARKVQAKHAVTVCNGTVALHLGLEILGVGPGDEVIMPTFTMVASANAVRYCGATPVFVDADPETWTMDVNKLEMAVTPRTKALMTVSIYGHPTHFGAVAGFCKRHGLKWIEDGAESHGALFEGKALAYFPDVTAYSFFANKIISTGEGGMICTNDSSLDYEARLRKNLGFKPGGPRNYIHEVVGYNYRMTNLQAAIGCAQTERFEELVDARRRNAALYNDLLKKHERFLQLPVEKPWARNCYWMYGILLKSTVPCTRDEFMQRLHEHGVDTRPFFHPMHLQPIFKTDQKLQIAENLGLRGFYVPSSSHLTTDDIEYVCEKIGHILAEGVAQ